MENMACSEASDSSGKEPKCEELVIDIPPILEEWSVCCIYRVPKKLRQVNEEAYTPKLVSIGPFHRKLEELRGMKMLKQKYLKEFCDRTGGKSKEYLTNIIESNKEEVSRSYSEAIEVIDPFVEEILLDAIFIIELFLRYSENPEMNRIIY
jgi:hypothetical protein